MRFRHVSAVVAIIGISLLGSVNTVQGAAQDQWPRAIVLHSIKLLETSTSYRDSFGYDVRGANERTHERWILADSVFVHGDVQTSSPEQERLWLKAYLPVFVNGHRVGQPRINVEELRVGNVEASRSRNASWQCNKLSSPPSNNGYPISYFDHIRKYLKVINVGRASVHGVPVWHIRASGRIRIVTGTTTNGKGVVVRRQYSTGPSVANYFVSRQDGTLRKINGQVQFINTQVTTGRYGKQHQVTVRFKLAFWDRFSRFGEKVSVQLPSVCAS